MKAIHNFKMRLSYTVSDRVKDRNTLNHPKKRLYFWLNNPDTNLHFCFNLGIGLHFKYWIKRK